MRLLIKSLLLLGVVFISIFYFSEIRVGKSIVGDDEQVWSHENNNLEKAIINSRAFKGIEIDVVYDEESKSLNVRHDIDKAPSKNNIFQIIESTKLNKGYYWIDLKNLKKDNLEAIIVILNEYFKEDVALKSRVIIESPHAVLLNEIGKQGYNTSWWLPSLRTDEKISYLKFFILTKYILLMYEFNAISAHTRMLPIINYFHTKNNIHLWKHDHKDSLMVHKVKTILDVSNVRVVLVDYKTPLILTDK